MVQELAFQLNQPDVINEVIDGEAIILHLGTGRYYSARGCGAEAWAWLSTSVPVPAVVEALLDRYDTARDVVSAAVERFVGYLQVEGLVVPSVLPSNAPLPVPPNAPKGRFEEPALEGFTDLEDLLLLDPVHEVEPSRGWPYAVTAEAESDVSGG
jgi:coenzyme PQQ synthesis protein D (PqqD)